MSASEQAAQAAKQFEEDVRAAYARNGDFDPHPDPTIQEIEFDLWDAKRSAPQARREIAWAWLCPDVGWDLATHDESKDDDE